MNRSMNLVGHLAYLLLGQRVRQDKMVSTRYSAGGESIA